MSRKIYLFLSLFLLTFILFACNKKTNNNELLYTLEFYVDGELYYEEVLKENELINFPDEPNKENYTFIGWFSNNTLFEDDKLSLNFLQLEAKFETEINEEDEEDEVVDEGEEGEESEDPADPLNYTGYYESINDITDDELFDSLHNLVLDTGIYETITYGQARYYLEESDLWVNKHPDYLNLIYSDTVRKETKPVFTFKAYAIPKWDQANTWNREHVWPKSLLGPTNWKSDPKNGTRGIDADFHNLRAADVGVNGHKTNNPFLNEITFYHSTWGDNDFGNFNNRFYPGDNHRGDVARILMYMNLRWKENAPLSRVINIETLLGWHEIDPVDEFEINRNNVIYEYQHNRNPFIDHPELAYRIYGEKEIISASSFIPDFKINNSFFQI